MSSRQRPSLKGRGSEIFFSSDDDAEPTDGSQPDAIGEGGEPRTTMSEDSGHRQSYSGEMKKLTFNLPLELAFALDEVQLNVRRATRSGVTKTEIVQAALERTVREFQEDGVESRLLKDLGLEPVREGVASASDGHTP